MRAALCSDAPGVHAARVTASCAARGPSEPVSAAGNRPARRVGLVVSGTVQGVFFRDTVRGAALERGVAGWARNCADGDVEVVLEGPPEAVEEVVEVCRRGPSGASVSDLDVEDQEPRGESGFEVR